MLSGAALRKTGPGWEFSSEAALEDFVWANLKQLLGLAPLERQYSVKGEVCDILAIDNNQKLVVIELKNAEDRYLVQQLTRYYDNLLEEKPFKEQLDYEEPVRLVAVAPSFHKHNLIDRKHNKLEFDFLHLEVFKKDDFYLQLKNIDTEQVYSIEIPYREIDFNNINEGILTPPRLLLDWLGSCTVSEEEGILKIRQQILGFDNRIKEITESKGIKYGRGKTNLCAELVFERKSKKLILFLWLPIPNRKTKAVGRMQVGNVDTEWNVYWTIGHVPKGIGKMEIGRTKLYFLLEGSEQVNGYIDDLVSEALETWRNRL